ncbi:MAG TPA: Fis family transcriptional regulator [Candidatus Thioglobus sp.]|nr:Fis family transcriptional regulator [Candidatus Thioglobus sp.]
MNWRSSAEKKLELFSDWIFENCKKTLLLTLLGVVALGSQLPSLTLDTSTEGFLHKSDQMRIDYDAFRDQFGRDEKIMLAVKTNNIFNIDFLAKLDALHKALEQQLPHIKAVNSLINARNTYGSGGSLVVGRLIELLPSNKQELSELKEKATQNSLFDNLLYSEDYTITVITVDTNTYSLEQADVIGDNFEFDADFTDDFDFEFDAETETQGTQKAYLSDAENDEIIIKAQEIISDFEAEDFKIHLTGSAAIAGIFKQALTKDSQVFISLMIVMIVVVLFALFRRISGVLLPLSCVVLTLISTLSLMAAFAVPFTMATQIMPTFLLAVVTGASIHLLAVFYKDYTSSEDKKASLRYAMGHSGLAIVMTSVTTAVGLWSFSFSEVAPVADLGRFASAGVMVGLFFTLVLLPALIALIDIKHKQQAGSKGENSVMDRGLLAISRIATSRAKGVVIISALLIAIAIFFAVQLRFSHHPLNWLPDDNFARIATETVDESLNGSLTLEVIIDTSETNGLYNPEVLKTIDRVSSGINGVTKGNMFVGKALSLVDVVKEINRALNNNLAEHYVIPDERSLIAQELVLFGSSGSADLEALVDDDYSKARLTLKVPWVDSLEAREFIKDAQIYLDKEFEGLATVTFTGIGTLMTVTFEQAIYSSAFSYLLAFSFITVLMVLLVGNLKIGLISMLPNILPILFIAMIMNIFNMPLDMFTLLIGAIALGLAVDDTVHFMHNFRRYELQYNDVDKAVELTLMGTGRAITLTSIVLALGFLVLTFSSMNHMFNFGILTAGAILTALLADFFLMPAIMKLIVKDRKDL